MDGPRRKWMLWMVVFTKIVNGPGSLIINLIIKDRKLHNTRVTDKYFAKGLEK